MAIIDGNRYAHNLEYIAGCITQSNIDEGRAQGARQAYENVAKKFDPEKTCQDCGREYRVRGSSYGESREEHEARCEERKTRMAAEREQFQSEFLAKYPMLKEVFTNLTNGQGPKTSKEK